MTVEGLPPTEGFVEGAAEGVAELPPQAARIAATAARASDRFVIEVENEVFMAAD